MGISYICFRINNHCMAQKKGTRIATLPDFSQTPRVDKVGVEERVSRFQKRSIKMRQKCKGCIWRLV